MSLVQQASLTTESPSAAVYARKVPIVNMVETAHPSAPVRAPYAVLFRTHFWDPFVQRRFDDIKTRIGCGDLWILADQTSGSLPPLPHDKVFVTHDEQFVRSGLPNHPERKISWYNADYSLIWFHRSNPYYDTYFLIEYDAVVNISFDDIYVRISESHYDFVGLENRESFEKWGAWRKTCESFWPAERILKRLLCISAFSSRAITVLDTTRFAHAALFATGTLSDWPYCEGFVPTAINEAGLTLGNLSSFGSVDGYDWWPPHNEADLPSLRQKTFLHPVLEGKRYVASLLKYRWKEYFDPRSSLRLRLDRMPRDVVFQELFSLICRQRDVSLLIALYQIIMANSPDSLPASYLRVLRQFIGAQPTVNLTHHGFCYQSSTSPWSTGATRVEDAQRAINGVITGNSGFHTAKEISPWWMIDLGCPCLISEMNIFNRRFEAARARNFSIWISLDCRNWILVHSKQDASLFGGAEGKPYSITWTEDAVLARFVRLELDAFDYFHLDEIDIYGIRITI